MNNVGFIYLMSVLLSKPLPESPVFKKTIVYCADVNYTFQTEGYKYAGFAMNGKEYLTNFENSVILQQVIEKCEIEK